MAKRMQFSVVGLPHYTIWHLYEPSVDDIRRMEEMEQERRAREEEERRKQERIEKISVDFDTEAGKQFEKDKEAMRDAAREENRANKAAVEAEKENAQAAAAAAAQAGAGQAQQDGQGQQQQQQ